MAARIILGLLVFLLVLTLAFIAWAWRGEVAPIEPPARASFDSGLIIRGASLAAIGDCVACHTAPDGKAYAGGRALKTTFGTIYGTNITPDAETGIGRWSEAAFIRAMREGVDRRGRHLYPAFPYDHFTLLSDEDLQAIYAFVMTREPVRAETPPNALAFPMGIRMLVAGWKLLFLERAEFRSDPAQSAEWNRGAYLAQGLGHCGACHTPRNFLGAEKKRAFLAGGEIEGWHAPAINAASRAPVPWTAETLYEYLRHGIENVHAVATGPMAPVVHNLGAVPEQEVRAISTYIASVMGPPNPEQQRRAEQALARSRAADDAGPATVTGGTGSKTTIQQGRVIYEGTCLVCHGSTNRPPGASTGEALHLSLAIALSLPTSGNLIRIVLQGIAPPDGEPGPFMPGYAGALTDDQVAALATYLRADFTDRPEWPGVEREVRKVKQQFQ